MDNVDVITLLKGGKRLEQPELCPSKMWVDFVDCYVKIYIATYIALWQCETHIIIPNINRSMHLALHVVKEWSTLSQIVCAKHATGVRILQVINWCADIAKKENVAAIYE